MRTSLVVRLFERPFSAEPSFVGLFSERRPYCVLNCHRDDNMLFSLGGGRNTLNKTGEAKIIKSKPRKLHPWCRGWLQDFPPTRASRSRGLLQKGTNARMLSQAVENFVPFPPFFCRFCYVYTIRVLKKKTNSKVCSKKYSLPSRFDCHDKNG